MPLLDFFLRLLCAIVAGGSIGLERQRKRKYAGLRTNTLVATGSCIFVLISIIITENTGDPSRIIGQIVTGVGFLGAGVILHHGISVQGLTTAATIWCSAAVGSLAGMGLYLEAGICTVMVIIVNTLFRTYDWHNPFKHDDDENGEING